ncbi:hypothetical protein FRC03_010523 [Tulasnella sp. 419]|nr:hypothetical protein FRC03_010523 [Tulasnella sp. 419]
MDLERLTQILEHDGSDLVFSVGVIKGYPLHQVAGANYPAIIHSIQSQARFSESRPKNDTIAGIIVKGLTPDDMKRVRDYDGSMYEFMELQAHQLDKFRGVRRRYSRQLEEIAGLLSIGHAVR